MPFRWYLCVHKWIIARNRTEINLLYELVNMLLLLSRHCFHITSSFQCTIVGCAALYYPLPATIRWHSSSNSMAIAECMHFYGNSMIGYFWVYLSLGTFSNWIERDGICNIDHRQKNIVRLSFGPQSRTRIIVEIHFIWPHSDLKYKILATKYFVISTS